MISRRCSRWSSGGVLAVPVAIALSVVVICAAFSCTLFGCVVFSWAAAAAGIVGSSPGNSAAANNRAGVTFMSSSTLSTAVVAAPFFFDSVRLLRRRLPQQRFMHHAGQGQGNLLTHLGSMQLFFQARHLLLEGGRFGGLRFGGASAGRLRLQASDCRLQHLLPQLPQALLADAQQLAGFPNAQLA